MGGWRIPPTKQLQTFPVESEQYKISGSKIYCYTHTQTNFLLLSIRISNIFSSTVTVYINVKDVNDNSPEFKRSTYATSVPENIVPGAGILDLEATDLDSGDNGRIQYSIIGN